MADQDFNIKVVTTADTTGIKLTQRELEALQTAARQGNQQAITAIKQLTDAQRQAASVSRDLGPGLLGGLAGGVAGGLISVAVSQFRAFAAEQDRVIEQMIRTQEKLKELGNSIIKMQDDAINARRTAVEPLEQSFIRLQQEIIRLKTEQGLLNLPQQGEEWKNYAKDIAHTESELEKVRQQLEKTGKTGIDTSIPMPKAGKGQSQELVNEIERNRRAAEEQLKEDIWEIDPETGAYRLSGKKQFPVFQPPPPPPLSNPPPGENMNAQPITLDLIRQAFEQSMLKYWGP